MSDPDPVDAGVPAGHDFTRGVRDIAPVLVGVVPFALTFATLAAERGIPFHQIMVMSGGMFAGASQFVTVELWTMPLPFWPIVLSVLAVNFRHVLYSAAFSRKVRHWPASAQMFGFFFLVDPNYAFVELRGGQRLSVAYYAGLSAPLYVAWMAATAVGAWFGTRLGDPRALAIDFVFAAYFTYLIVSFRQRRGAGAIVLASVAVALGVYFTIGAPWHIVSGAFGGVTTAYVAAARAKGRVTP